MSNKKLFDYFANQHGLVLIDSELHEITLEVCRSIGIDSNEPAEWVENVKLGLADYEQLNDQLSKLRGENERLKANVLHYEINVCADLDREIELLRAEKSVLIDKICQLTDEINKLTND